MNKTQWKKAALVSATFALSCFLIAGVGLLWLYFTGFPTDAVLPSPLTAATLGVPIYFALAVICYAMATPRPPRTGKPRSLQGVKKRLSLLITACVSLSAAATETGPATQQIKIHAVVQEKKAEKLSEVVSVSQVTLNGKVAHLAFNHVQGSLVACTKDNKIVECPGQKITQIMNLAVLPVIMPDGKIHLRYTLSGENNSFTRAESKDGLTSVAIPHVEPFQTDGTALIAKDESVEVHAFDKIVTFSVSKE